MNRAQFDPVMIIILVILAIVLIVAIFYLWWDVFQAKSELPEPGVLVSLPMFAKTLFIKHKNN